MTDIEIARNTKLERIEKIAKKLKKFVSILLK